MSQMKELAELERIALELADIEEQRLAKDRESKDLKKKEDNLRAFLIREMQEKELVVIETRKVWVDIERTEKPTAMDWAELYPYIKKHGAFDLLQKRLHEGAVKLRWEEDIVVPGVGTKTTDKVTVKRRV